MSSKVCAVLIDWLQALTSGAEGDWRGRELGCTRFFQLAARKIRPRAGWLPAQIQNPVLQGQFFLALLLIRGSKIEMRVDMLRLQFRRAAQMPNRFIDTAHFIQYAPQLEMGGDTLRIKLQRGPKSGMCVFHFAALIVDAAKIDMWLAPTRLHFADLLIDAYGFLDPTGLRLTAHGIFEQLVRRSRLHFSDFRRATRMKRKDKLARERLKRVLGGLPRNSGNLTSVRKKTEVFDGRLKARPVWLQCGHSPKELSGGNVVIGNALYGTQSDEVREVVEALAPS